LVASSGSEVVTMYEERDFGKEVCRSAERRGTRTAGDADWEGKERGAPAVESADLVEGRCLAGWGGLERRPDHRGSCPEAWC